VQDLVRRLREKHGVTRQDAAEDGAYARAPEQLDLFSRAEDPRRRATFGYRLV
jgi:hypothetical protein